MNEECPISNKVLREMIVDRDAKLLEFAEGDSEAKVRRGVEFARLNEEIRNLRTALVDAETYRPLDDRVYPIVYMGHPVAGNVRKNLKAAGKILHRIRAEHQHTHNIIAPWISECRQFDDSDPEQRERGLQKCMDIIAMCDELWMFGPRISDGMRLEAERAERNFLKVKDFTREILNG